MTIAKIDYKTIQREIDGADVSTTLFTGTTAWRLQAKLVKTVGPIAGSIGDALASLTKSKDVLKSDVNIGSVVEKLIDLFSDDRTFPLVKELLANTRINGIDMQQQDAVAFDPIFSGRIDLLYKVLLFIVEANFGSFFGVKGIGSIKERIQAALARVDNSAQRNT